MRVRQYVLAAVLVIGFWAVCSTSASASDVRGKQPLISNVTVSDVTSSSAAVSWLSSVEADSQVRYGVTTAYDSVSSLDATLTRSHTQVLSGLTANSVYHFSVVSRTEAGAVYEAGDFTLATAPVILEDMISDLDVPEIGPTSVVLTWTTATPANSMVDFGLTIPYDQVSELSPKFVTRHTVELSGLSPSTTYHCRVRSTDTSGRLGLSMDLMFSTSSIAPSSAFSQVHIFPIGYTSATITWKTAQPLATRVAYGLTSDYGSATALDSSVTQYHRQTLTGLTPNTLYHFRLESGVGASQPYLSEDHTFTTMQIRRFYPRFGPEANSFTGVAVTNLDSNDAHLDFTAFTATGAEVAADGLTNPAARNEQAGNQLASLQGALFGAGVGESWPLGWASVDSSTPQIAGFFLTFNKSLSFIDGAELASQPVRSFILPETGSQDYTTVVVANPNPVETPLTLTLVKTNGTVRGSVQTSIPAYGTYSADLITATFAGADADPSDYVRAVSTNGVIPYEFFGNVSKDVAVLSGQDVGRGGHTLYAPQYVVGGSWTSTLSIVNLESNSGLVTLQLVGDDGTQIGATKTVPILRYGKLYVSGTDFFLDSPPTERIQGYVRVTSNEVTLSGSVTFSDALNGSFITALPLTSTLQQSVVLSHVASNSTFFTGLAILNPNSADATVTIELYTAEGKREGVTVQVLSGGHRISRLLPEFFTALVGSDRSSGYVKVTADKGIICFGLFGTNSLSVLSAIPAQPGQLPTK
jgi:hypothetical protein